MGHARQRILLVDDDPGIMVAVKQALSAHGYQMTTATDGIAALDSFEREPSVLDLGADDYLVKPFRLAELLARVRAVLRRGSNILATRVVCGDLEIDTEKHRVLVAGRPIVLTPIEYALLSELAANVGRVLTTHLLLERVWGSQYSDATDYVKGVVRRLRVKLEPDPAHPRYIITEPHLGYRLSDLAI